MHSPAAPLSLSKLSGSLLLYQLYLHYSDTMVQRKNYYPTLLPRRLFTSYSRRVTFLRSICVPGLPLTRLDVVGPPIPLQGPLILEEICLSDFVRKHPLDSPSYELLRPILLYKFYSVNIIYPILYFYNSFCLHLLRRWMA